MAVRMWGSVTRWRAAREGRRFLDRFPIPVSHFSEVRLEPLPQVSPFSRYALASLIMVTNLIGFGWLEAKVGETHQKDKGKVKVKKPVLASTQPAGPHTFQRGGHADLCHRDTVGHADFAAGVHTDATPHTDNPAGPHCDGHSDGGGGKAGHFDGHADGPHNDSSTGGKAPAHIDSATPCGPVPHSDTPAVSHTDTGNPHTDTGSPHSDFATPHTDSGPPHSDTAATHTDVPFVPHTDTPFVPHTDTPAVAHFDAAGHSDNTAHTDTSPEAHGDVVGGHMNVTCPGHFDSTHDDIQGPPHTDAPLGGPHSDLNVVHLDATRGPTELTR